MNMQVNIAPTWGEIGVIVRRLAISGEQHAAILKIWPVAARRLAMPTVPMLASLTPGWHLIT